MSKLSYLRLATYLIAVLAFAAFRDQHTFIPVALADMERIDEQIEKRKEDDAWKHELERRRRENDAIAGRSGFEHSKRSGQELMAIVRKAIAPPQSDFDPTKGAEIGLRVVNGRLLWSICYHEWPPTPGGFTCVQIDDQTGETRILPGM